MTDNPNRGDDGALVASLSGFTQRKNITVTRSTGEVSAGNTTLRAVLAMGKEWVAAVFTDDTAEMQAAWAITDNRTRDLAETDQLAWVSMASQIDDDDLWAAASFDEADRADVLAALGEQAAVDAEVYETEGQERISVNEALDHYKASATRSVVFQFDLDLYPKVIAAMAKAKEVLEVQSNPELLAMLLDDYMG